MNPQSKSVIVALIGGLLFASGATLVLKAEALSTRPLPASMTSESNLIQYALDSTHMHAINGIGFIMLVAGAVLVVIALAAWIFSPSHSVGSERNPDIDILNY